MLYKLAYYEVFGGWYHKLFGKIIYKKKGLYSGSGFTNVLGTFISQFVAVIILLRMGYSIDQILKNFDFMITGDDLVIYSDFDLDYELFIEFAEKLFGIVYKLKIENIGTPNKNVFEFAGSV